MNLTTKLGALLGTVLLAASLAACTTGASKVEQPATEQGLGGPSEAPVAEAATTPEAPVAAPSPEEPDMIFAFGETIEYKDGIGLSVSAPVGYEATATGLTGDEGNNIVFNVKITNNSSKPYTPGVYGTLSSGGAEATQIFDTQGGLDGGPMTPVLPGQAVEWPVGFSVLDPADLTYAVSPGSFEYDQAIFTTYVQ